MVKSFPHERQYDKMDCGPTCLKIIAKHYGRYYSLQFLRDLCSVTKEGVSLADLVYASDKIGIKSHAVRCTFPELKSQVHLPAILHWGESHFVVIYRIKGDKIYISDPARGKVVYQLGEFLKKWSKYNDKGIVLLIEPANNFKTVHIEETVEQKNMLFDFLKYFTNYRKILLLLFLVMAVITGLNVFLPFISRSVIDIGVNKRDLQFIEMILVANLALIICSFFSTIIRDWIILQVSNRVSVNIISDYLSKLLKLPFSFFENKHPGDILQRAHDHERIRSFIMGNSLNIVFSLFSFSAFIFVLLVYSVNVFLIFIVGTLIYLTYIFLFFKARKQVDMNYFALMGKDQGFWIETINNIQEIKINNYETSRKLQWDEIQAKLFKQNLQMQSITNRQNVGAQVIDNLKNVSITFYCALLVINAKMTLGELLSIQMILGMLNGPIQQLVQFFLSFQMAKLSFSRIREIRSLSEEDNYTSNNNVTLPSSGTLKFSNVYFQYSARQPYVLQNLNFVIPEGKTTAFVGDSGSGKSTILKLLLRLYEPSSGDITVGEMNYKHISIANWRDECGSVFQNGKIFNDTVINNIVLNANNIDYKLLKRVVAIANMTQEIENMPLGYKTKIGENGRGISGGQKQRILIARALYRNPKYIFLDEATNALDSINEKNIVTSLSKVFLNKTVVIVAHRLSTIMNADQIIVMKDGKIIERGNHNFLMQQKGQYYQLFESQINVLNGADGSRAEITAN
ncbi:peptidase domain-containing ABC transporter [Chryseobacterium jejuense]|uniref:peptidase domain-containing ABC transporter n=1 Tax=Chryseobacterium jejuense TaxID=445960 RepID=UPI001AE9573B|nr:peptidase domain-containing ABC transporter [Chryseobacterium jejuense]MBP2616644.1 ATP-binding cassette subfamily B protein [Chryseobacterium jejuense]